MTLVHDHKRIELVDDLKERRLIRVFNGAVRFAQYLCKLSKIAVFLKRLPSFLFAGAERIIG